MGSCIIRSVPLQLVSSSPPISCNSTTIFLEDGSIYAVFLKRVIQGNAQVEQLDEDDWRRVADTTPSCPTQVIFDITKVAEGQWRITSHNVDKIVSGKMHINISGQTGVQFGSGNHMDLNF